MEGAQRIIKRQPALALLVLIGLVAFGGVALATGNREFVFYVVVMLGLIALIVWLDARVGFSAPALWGLGVWALLHLAGGTVPIPDSAPRPEGSMPALYSLWLIPGAIKFDVLVHAFGFFVATLVCWEALAARIGADAARAAGPIALAALGGYDNTGWDLVANALGAAAAAALLARQRRSGAKSAGPAP